MKTRHIIAIGLLTVAAVGIFAYGIKHNKVNPKVMQTNAYYEVENYDRTDNELQIIGTQEQANCTWWQNDGAPIVGITSYSINYNGVLEYTINLFGFYYIDDEQDLYTVQTKQFSHYIENTYYEQILLQDITTLYIYQSEVIPRTNDIKFTWQIYNGTTLISTCSSGWLLYNNFTLNLNYEVQTRYLIDVIPVSNILNNLEDQYQEGAAAANDANGTGIVDIRGLMLNILTIPFTFISQAFDVTLWEGTAYEFHLAPFIKGMIAIAAILFIIKLFTTGFSVLGNYTGGTGEKISRWRMNRSQRKLNKSKTNLNNRTNPNVKTIKKE